VQKVRASLLSDAPPRAPTERNVFRNRSAASPTDQPNADDRCSDERWMAHQQMDLIQSIANNINPLLCEMPSVANSIAFICDLFNECGAPRVARQS
jgi:hypothetical protein